jgi:transcription elongation factor Elf1
MFKIDPRLQESEKRARKKAKEEIVIESPKCPSCGQQRLTMVHDIGLDVYTMECDYCGYRKPH